MNAIERNYIETIDELINKLDRITDNQTFHEQKDHLVGKTINAVHAIADCYERNKEKLSGDNKNFLLAFCYLNNQIKHDRDLEVFSEQIYSAVLPTYLPCRLGSTSYSIIWADFENHGRENAAGKREHYDDLLKGKDVKDTLIAAKQILLVDTTVGYKKEIIKISKGESYDQL